MSTFQKVIKYLALCLAIVIILNIFYAGIFIIKEISYYFDDKEIEMTELSINDTDISFIDIDLKATKLTIKTGEKTSVETNNDDITVTQDGNKLLIKEKGKASFKKSELIIYIKEDLVFENASIKLGAGKADIDTIKSKSLHLELGAGKVDINNLYVSDKANITSGVGSVEIKSSNINNLDLSLGVGRFELKSILTGKNNIEAGVGELIIKLEDDLDNYTISTKKGLGSIKLNNDDVSNQTVSTGPNTINVEGGIGSINIKTK